MLFLDKVLSINGKIIIIINLNVMVLFVKVVEFHSSSTVVLVSTLSRKINDLENK